MWGLFVKNHAISASKKQKISVLYLETNSKITEKTVFTEEFSPIYTLTIYFSKPSCKILYYLKLLNLYFQGLKIVRKRQGSVDIIHVHILTRMGFLAWITSKWLHIPYIITEHWSRYLPSVNAYGGFLRKIITRLIVQNAEALLPVTQDLKNALQKHGLANPQCIVIPNVVAPSFFNNITVTKNLTTKRIIHVSTFEDRSKNISGIVNAISEIKNFRKDFKMVFVGHGIDFEEISSQVRDKGLNEVIEFTGLLENEALVREYTKASFLLINSNYENMPVVINEAFASGLPVLSTHVGGISEHLNNQRGRLIEVGNHQQLIENLNWMLDHFHEFDSLEIRKYAFENFSMESVGSKLQQIYQKALKS